MNLKVIDQAHVHWANFNIGTHHYNKCYMYTCTIGHTDIFKRVNITRNTSCGSCSLSVKYKHSSRCITPKPYTYAILTLKF